MSALLKRLTKKYGVKATPETQIKIIRDFIESVVDEQKSHGDHGDSVYISEGEGALEALSILEKEIKE